MTSESSRIFEPYLPFYTLLEREVRRFFTVTIQTLLTPVVSASLYLLVFGVSLGQRVSVMEGFSYLEFVIPGLILMGTAQNAFANTSSSLFMARYLGFIVDFLVTPITPRQFILAHTCAAMLRGVLVGLMVLLVSSYFTTLPWTHPLSAMLMILMTSFFFAQFGIIAAIYSPTFEKLSMFTNFLISPLIYLGGLFYPVSLLPGVWADISMLNPLFYMIDGFRHSVLGKGDIAITTSLLVTACFSLSSFLLASSLIKSGKNIRT